MKIHEYQGKEIFRSFNIPVPIGYTITNFHSSSGIQYEMDRVPKFLKKDSKRIAEIAVNATLNGKRVCIPTKTYKVIVFLLNIIPKSLFSIFAYIF